MSAYLDVLRYLPPTLPTFDLLGRLLRDATRIGTTTIADLVRTEVLGRFIHECINWLDHAENEERRGMISDDRFPKGVQNVRRSHIVCTAVSS
jgi:CCR4-NOT transcription complex subunit 11